MKLTLIILCVVMLCGCHRHNGWPRWGFKDKPAVVGTNNPSLK